MLLFSTFKAPMREQLTDIETQISDNEEAITKGWHHQIFNTKDIYLYKLSKVCHSRLFKI